MRVVDRRAVTGQTGRFPGPIKGHTGPNDAHPTTPPAVFERKIHPPDTTLGTLMVGGQGAEGGRKSNRDKGPGKQKEDPKADRQAPAGSLRARRNDSAAEKRKTGKEDSGKKKPQSLQSRITSTAALVVVLLLAGFLGFVDGGPKAEENTPNPSPQLEEWSITATHGDGTTEVLCDHTDDCGLDDLWPAVTAQATCTFEGRLWLTTETNPVILRSIHLDAVNTTTMGGMPDHDGEGLNFTMSYHDQYPEDGLGAWLRPVAKRIDITSPMQCDAMSITVKLMLTGKTLFGDDWASQQSITELIHQDIDGIVPGGGARNQSE